MPLTDTAIRNAKAQEKPYKLFDGGGLFLLVTPSKGQGVTPNGEGVTPKVGRKVTPTPPGKWWRLKYRFEGKERLLSLGTYPEVSLLEAREKREEAKKLLRNGVDPALERQAVKAAESGAGSFETVALEWLAKMGKTWVPRHTETITRRLESFILPRLGPRPINEITAPDLLKVLHMLEARGTVETAHRVKQICGQVFRYAIATGRADRDPSADLRGALAPAKSKHMASITDPKGVAGLLRAIDEYHGSIITACALKLAPLVFVRPGELRHAEWSEIALDAAEWRIPAAKMKMKSPHIVPLSRQAVAILQEIEPLTGSGRYVFPGLRTGDRPMSNNTVNAALRRLGFTKEEMTGHGFRAMASTLLNEQGWNRDAIERQLAHAERNKVRAAYNFAEMLPERRKMMQAWADYLDRLKEGEVNKVVPLRAAR